MKKVYCTPRIKMAHITPCKMVAVSTMNYGGEQQNGEAEVKGEEPWLWKW